MKRLTSILLVSFLIMPGIFVLQPAHAEDMSGIGVGGKVSSLGVGGEVVARVVDNLNLRAGLQGIAYDYDDTYSGIDYDVELELFSGMLLADFFPLGNNFRISAGMMVNQNEVVLDATPFHGTINIGGVTYPASLVGTLKGTVDFNAVAPYVGLGYGGSFSDTSNLSFFLDLGILFQGSPDVSYTASGILANNPAFQANLEQERRELEEDIDEYEYYPVVSLGVIYKF